VSLSDNTGRYAYDQQPSICQWNLKKLGEALSLGGELSQDQVAEGLDLWGTSMATGRAVVWGVCVFMCGCVYICMCRYDTEFEAAYLDKMRKKVCM